MEASYAGCLYLTLLIAVLMTQTWGFNIDIESRTIYTGPEGSMFGFSVAQHRRGRFLVGAPRSNTTQDGVLEGGAVYNCATGHTQSCQVVDFSQTGSGSMYDGVQFQKVEQKSHQLFGSSLSAAKTDDSILACAPHYVYFSGNFDKQEPVGSCILRVRGAPLDTKYYSPCKRDVDRFKERENFKLRSKAMYGFSSMVSSDGERLLVGAVGSYTWRGELFAHNVRSGDAVSTDHSHLEPFTYLGYTVAVGHFTGNPIEDVVASSPRAYDLRGMVAIFTHRLDHHLNITGMQMGEYFGYSIAVGDFNGDSLDDIAVGAPLYSYSREFYEVGRVYVHYQTQSRTFLNSRGVLSGIRRVGARFGAAVSSLGDISLDSYDDLAVGAPYDGPDQKGAVYIFHGSGDGIRPVISQVIYASTVDPSLRTFGFSLSGGSDMDRNGYTDLLVGAFEADRAVVFLARPILDIIATLTISPSMVDPDNKTCRYPDSSKSSCITVTMSIYYTGYNVPKQIDLQLSVYVDIFKPSSPRAFLLDSTDKITMKTNRVTLANDRLYIEYHRAFLKSGIRDKLTPLAVNFTYGLIEAPPAQPGSLTPVVNYFQPSYVMEQVHIIKDCGGDEICIPDLSIDAHADTKEYILGSKGGYLDVRVTIANNAEDAFESQLVVIIPHGTNYVNIIHVMSTTPVKRTGSTDTSEGTRLAFDIGNPLPSKQLVTLTVRVSPTNITGARNSTQFHFFVNSSNPEHEATSGNNQATVLIPVVAFLDIRLTGVSRPEQIIYDPPTSAIVIGNLRTIGPDLVHRYQLTNHGPSTVENATVEIYWPSYLEDRMDLLYLTASPRVRGNAECTSDDIDIRGIARRSGGRRRRAAEITMKETKQLVCLSESPRCTLIRCLVRNMAADDIVLIEVQSRVWVRSLHWRPFNNLVVSSTGVAIVNSVPYEIQLPVPPRKRFTVDTSVVVAAVKENVIWIYAVSGAGGVVLLGVIVVVLWKCGFFKRTKPEDADKDDKDGYVEDEDAESDEEKSLKK